MKTLSELLSSSALQTYLVKQDQIAQLTLIFNNLLQNEWVQNCQLANFENGLLILGVSNSGWATRVRYAAPQLIASLRAHPRFASLKEIKCKIIPSLPEVVLPPTKKLPVSAKELLFETAQQIANGELKEALLRLSSRA